MTTLIIQKDAQGDIKGRCDAKCYNAKRPECTCICGGVNHGKGHNQAIDNTRQFFNPGTQTDSPDEYIIKPVNYHFFKE